MNLFLSIEPEQGFIFVLCIVWLIITIKMIIKFFEMAQDLKSISKDISSILSVIKNNGSGQSDEWLPACLTKNSINYEIEMGVAVSQ